MNSEQSKRTPPEPLPSAWIDRIFSKLTARYGRDFLSKYEGVDLDVVKADWAEELAGLQHRPQAIKYALDRPDTKPPNVIEFKAACARAPVRADLALEAPKASQCVIDRAIAAAREMTRFKGDRLDPIRLLRKREMEGDKTLTLAQREFWRIALKDEMARASQEQQI